MENWRPIEAYAYEVSDRGKVRSRRGVLSSWLDSNGRPTVRLYQQGVPREFRVQGLVLGAFVGPKPPGLECCHRDGNVLNNVLSNLRWDTRSANQNDSVRHGTHVQARKEECPRGHGLADWNLVPAQLRRGRRACLACSRAIRLKYYARSQGHPFDLAEVADQKYQELYALHVSTPGGPVCFTEFSQPAEVPGGTS